MKLNIAQNLRKYRKERGLTQEQLAKALAVSAQSVSKWECGDGYPDIELLPNIANHLKISVDALIGNDTGVGTIYLEQRWSKGRNFPSMVYFTNGSRILSCLGCLSQSERPPQTSVHVHEIDRSIATRFTNYI